MIKANKFDVATILIFFLAFLYFTIPSKDASISGDEDIHLTYSKRVLNYFITGGEDKSYRDEIRGPDYAYNFTFDVFVEIVRSIFGIEDSYRLRHFFNATIGWLILLVSGLIAKRYFGWTAFVLTTVFFMVSPRFLGHSFNNPKDIPFAFGYILSIYSIFRFCDELPKPSWKTALYVGLSIGLCLNFRIGGLLLIPYFGLFVILKFFVDYGTKMLDSKHLTDYYHVFVKGLSACVLAYFLMVIFWPYALEAPLSNPFKALEIMSDFKVGIRQLFEGVNVTSTALPHNYIYKWMYMTIPIVVLVGLLILPFSCYKVKSKKSTFIIIALIFSVVFPITYAIYRDSNVYGGWRHFIFIYPSLVILSAAGVGLFADWLQKKSRFSMYGVGLLVAILCIHPLSRIIKNHPVEYVYFNELSGGMNKVYGNYEMDYYMHSIKPAMDWLKKKNIINESDSIIIASNHSNSVNYYSRNSGNIRSIYTRYYERLNSDWDYAVYVNVYIDQYELKYKQFPPTGTIHTVDVDGKPMCAIVKRPSKASVGFTDDLKNGNLILAKNKLLDYYQADRNNFEANINLALIYNQTGQRDSLNLFLSEAKRVNDQRFQMYVQQK